MSTKKTLGFQMLSTAGMLGFAAASLSAFAGGTDANKSLQSEPQIKPYDGHPGSTALTKLLQSGYEVKAGYAGHMYSSEVNIMILQKGGSVYQCSTSNLGNTEYANSYSCVQVIDTE